MIAERNDLSNIMRTLEVRNRQITAVHTISRQLSDTLDLDERLKTILTVSMQAVDAVAGSILVYRAADDKLVFRHLVGPSAKELLGFAMNASDGVAGAVFRSGQPQITNRPRESAAHRQDVGEKVGFVTQNLVTVPVKYQEGQPVGVMQILNKQTGEFDDNDLEVLEIVASIAASAIENANLHREAELSAVAHAVGDLSHDIKNKVTPISLAVDTLWPMLDDVYQAIDQTTKEMDDEKGRALRDATSLLRDFYAETFQICKDQIQEVQDYTKLIADALKGSIAEPQMDPTDLNQVAEKQLASLDSIAKSRGVRLVRDYHPVPIARFDSFLVERAVYNLVNNAIPETPEGGSITVRTRAREEGDFPNGNCIAVEVEDTGRGMPRHVLERILRGDAKSTKPGGTGLGTKIVYNAVAAHRGAFEGDSEEGVGTKFRLKLPYLPE